MARQNLTVQDINHYESLITKGNDGIDEFYNDLAHKGYSSASWARDEYNKNTFYGTSVAIFFESQTGVGLNKNIADSLKKASAEETIKILKIKINSGKNSEDLTYEESNKIRQKAYASSGFSGVQWIFEKPIEIKGKTEGKAAAERWYEELRDVQTQPLMDKKQLKKLMDLSAPTHGPGLTVSPDMIEAYGSDLVQSVNKMKSLRSLKYFMDSIEGTSFPYGEEEQKSIMEAAKTIRNHNGWDPKFKKNSDNLYNILMLSDLEKAKIRDKHIKKYGADVINSVKEWKHNHGSTEYLVFKYVENSNSAKIVSIVSSIIGGYVPIEKAIKATEIVIRSYKEGKNKSEIIQSFFLALKDGYLAYSGTTGGIETIDNILNEEAYLMDVILGQLSPYSDVLSDVHNWLKEHDYFKDFMEKFRNDEYKIIDPLVLDLDGDGIETVGINGFESVLFDHKNNGIRSATGWIGKDDALLVLDRNQDGKIDTGLELFGDNTVLKDGTKSNTGYQALAEFDDNGDGMIDEQDAIFAQLRAWQDKNQDGISQSDELLNMSEARVKALHLNHQNTHKNLGNGNVLARHGSYIKTDNTEAEMGDLHFASNLMLSNIDTAGIELNESLKLLPNLKGMGRLKDLRFAAAESEQLTNLLTQYSNAQTKQEQSALLDPLLIA